MEINILRIFASKIKECPVDILFSFFTTFTCLQKNNFTLSARESVIFKFCEINVFITLKNICDFCAPHMTSLLYELMQS